jgi:DNA processing protein
MQLPPLCSIHKTSDVYPSLLKQIYRPPENLYFQGDLSILQASLISIVGSRKMSPYGLQVLKQWVPIFVKNGLTIVSGLAYGVDAQAHRIALEHNGKCVAVMGGGLNHIYPASNLSLYKDILAQGGCGLSQFASDQSITKYNFPLRNQVVAGLVPLILIIEAGENSGTLITARAGVEYGREVFAVPGDIFRENSTGVNRLLRESIAQPATCIDDILSYYQKEGSIQLKLVEELKPALTGSLALLYDFISQGYGDFESLLERTNWRVADLQIFLSALELDGYIYLKEDRWQKTLL